MSVYAAGWQEATRVAEAPPHTKAFTKSDRNGIIYTRRNKEGPGAYRIPKDRPLHESFGPPLSPEKQIMKGAFASRS